MDNITEQFFIDFGFRYIKTDDGYSDYYVIDDFEITISKHGFEFIYNSFESRHVQTMKTTQQIKSLYFGLYNKDLIMK